jgi:Domain of unknown function (DUF5122) beta-propeller
MANVRLSSQSRTSACGDLVVRRIRALGIVLPLFVALTLVACASGTGSTTGAAKTTASVARHLALIDATTDKVDRSFSDANGSGANSVVADGHGGWYVAGGFTRIGNVKRPGLAHLNRDGTLDRSFTPDLPEGGVQAVTFGANTVFAIPGQTPWVFALDRKSGRRRWATHSEGTNLAFGNGVLYVGGVFDRVDGARREAVAALDPSTGKPTGWDVRGWGSLSPEVGSIVAGNGAVYLGGVFTRIGGVPDSCDVAAVSAKTGRTVWVPKESMTKKGGDMHERRRKRPRQSWAGTGRKLSRRVCLL